MSGHCGILGGAGREIVDGSLGSSISKGRYATGLHPIERSSHQLRKPGIAHAVKVRGAEQTLIGHLAAKHRGVAVDVVHAVGIAQPGNHGLYCGIKGSDAAGIARSVVGG